MVVSIALRPIIRLKLPTCRLEGKRRVRSWAAGLHVTKFSTTETLDPRVIPAGTCLQAKNLGSDQGMNGSPEAGVGHPAVWRSDASRIPFDVPVQTSVVGWVTWLGPVISY